MATAVLELKADASQLKREAKDAEKAIKGLAEGVSGKGPFSQLNIGAKDLSQSLRGIKDQFASGDIFGALANSARVGGALAKSLALSPILGPTAVAMAAIGGAAAGMWRAMGKSTEMNLLAESSAMTTKGLMGFQYALSRVGIDMEEAPGLISHFANALMELGDPASKTALALRKVGLSAGSFQGKTIEQSLEITKNALDSTTNSTLKLLAADALFSERRGSRMIPALRGLAESQDLAEKNGAAEIYQKSGQTFMEFEFAIKRLQPSLDGFFAGMASKVIPGLNDAASKIETSSQKMARAGEALGILMKDAGGVAAAIITTPKKVQGAATEFGRGALLETLKSLGMSPASKEELEKTKNKRLGIEPAPETGMEHPFMQKLKQVEAYGNLPGEDPSKADQGLNILFKPLAFFAPIVDSLTKIGGGGGGVGNNTVDIQREQLNVLRQISDGVRSWAQSFKPDSNSYLPSINGNAAFATIA